MKLTMQGSRPNKEVFYLEIIDWFLLANALCKKRDNDEHVLVSVSNNVNILAFGC